MRCGTRRLRYRIHRILLLQGTEGTAVGEYLAVRILHSLRQSYRTLPLRTGVRVAGDVLPEVSFSTAARASTGVC